MKRLVISMCRMAWHTRSDFSRLNLMKSILRFQWMCGNWHVRNALYCNVPCQLSVSTEKLKCEKQKEKMKTRIQTSTVNTLSPFPCTLYTRNWSRQSENKKKISTKKHIWNVKFHMVTQTLWTNVFPVSTNAANDSFRNGKTELYMALSYSSAHD